MPGEETKLLGNVFLRDFLVYDHILILLFCNNKPIFCAFSTTNSAFNNSALFSPKCASIMQQILKPSMVSMETWCAGMDRAVFLKVLVSLANSSPPSNQNWRVKFTPAHCNVGLGNIERSRINHRQ